MCRFAKRCENFYADPDSPGNCLLLCQKNPLALSIALMPDRYVEIDRPVDPNQTVLDLKKEDTTPRNRNVVLQEEYDEMVTATQDLDNESVEFEYDLGKDLEDKFKSSVTNMDKLLKRTNDNRNSTEMDAEVTQAIKDNVTDHEEPVLHPLDEINFEPVERIAVADQPDTPDNPKVYIKTRDRGRPKMSEEEKEISRVKREREKEFEEEKKHQDAIDRREAMKKKVAKKKKTKKKVKK